MPIKINLITFFLDWLNTDTALCFLIGFLRSAVKVNEVEDALSPVCKQSADN